MMLNWMNSALSAGWTPPRVAANQPDVSTEVQPGERAGLPGKVDQMRCAQNIPDRVFEAARVCRFAFPTATREHVAERVASYYGYFDEDARRVFVGAVVAHILSRGD